MPKESINQQKLAIFGGQKAITIPHPHEIWPPKATKKELQEIALQRNKDIGIKGKTGPIAEFEEMFANFLEKKVTYQITYNSGTSALLAAYFALGLNQNDEVVGPALTYHAALSPVFILKGNVRLVDIDLQTRCIDPNKIEEKITNKTKIITVVHQWGHPAHMDQIIAIANKYHLKIIEDCSHAHGSRYKGRLCGTFGDIAVFSLQASKTLFAGEGGILVTNNQQIYERATLLGHYRDRSREEVKSKIYHQYWTTGFGLKLRMSPFNAIVAKHSLLHFPEIITERHQCLNYFNQQLKTISYLEPIFIADYAYMGAWYGFKPLYHPEKLCHLSRDKLVQILNAEGVEVSSPSGPILSSQPLYQEVNGAMFPTLKKKPNTAASAPNALIVAKNALSFPTFSNFQRDKKIIDEYIIALKKIESISHSCNA
jgi:dTDP-4-amino-4,6-dideoxygalactose transaminase